MRAFCVLQGPYASRPYLPPAPGRYYAVVARKDMNVPLSDMVVQFQAIQTRGPKKQMISLHPPVPLSAQRLRDTLSASAAPDESVTLTWAVNDQNEQVRWIMLVIQAEVLERVCLGENHSNKVEEYARMDDEAFEV